MGNLHNKRNTWIWLSVLILLVCVTATAIGLFSRLDSFLLDDEGAISLTPEIPSGTDDSEDEIEDTQHSGIASTATPQAIQPPKNPGFEASDDQTVWSTNTQVEIFRVSYVNGEKVITVNSDNGDKLIAPGTENSYTFKLKNTGNVALDYTVAVDAYFTPGDIVIPITGRISRHDSEWIVGDKNTYADVKDLDQAEDTATLGAGRYAYYTLDWLWPYESGNDDLDTLLGNMAVEQELVFTIVITTIATESSDPYVDWGINSPQTDENSHITLWITLMVVCFTTLILLAILTRQKDKLTHGG